MRIRLRLKAAVMHTMPVWRRHQQASKSFEPTWKLYIGMIQNKPWQRQRKIKYEARNGHSDQR